MKLNLTTCHEHAKQNKHNVIIQFSWVPVTPHNNQSLKGAVVVTLCQKEAEVKCQMDIYQYIFCGWDLVEISIGNYTSASFWQRIAPTAPFNTWDKRFLFMCKIAILNISMGFNILVAPYIVWLLGLIYELFWWVIGTQQPD